MFHSKQVGSIPFLYNDKIELHKNTALNHIKAVPYLN